ncbi:MAG TPA: hypothetical protein VHM88_10455 [Candidatus Acidoferrales bacterium]|nr:hypothetical protein [Candidatus Acidoferrales bacterium]
MQFLSLLVAIRTTSLGANAVPAIVIHIALGAFFVYFLVKREICPAGACST